MQPTQMTGRLWLILCAVGLLIYLLNIDYTAVNMAIRPVSEEIAADLSDLQWLLSAYVLVWSGLVIPASRLADFLGKRLALIIGLSLFVAGSAVTGVSDTLIPLIGGRVLQGVGAALFTSPAWALIFTSAPPEKQGFAMGFVMSFAGLGLATGPTLGGFLIDLLSWRWIFYINIPLGLLVIFVLLKFAPKDEAPTHKPPFNGLAATLLMCAMGLFFFTLNRIEEAGASWQTLAPAFGASAALLAAYILRERFSKDPLVPGHLLKNKIFMSATLGEFFMAINYALVLVLVALYLQNTLQYSSRDTGLIFIAMTISMGALSPIGGRMTDRFGARTPMLWGCAITALGFVVMAQLSQHTSLPFVCLALFLVGMGLGLYFSACNTAMLQSVPPEDLNVASGFYTMFMLGGNTLSVITSTSLVVLWGRTFLFESLSKGHAPLSADQHTTLASLIAQVEPQKHTFEGFASQDVPLLLDHIAKAFVGGFSRAMWIGFVCSLLAFLFTLRLSKSAQVSATPTLGHVV